MATIEQIQAAAEHYVHELLTDQGVYSTTHLIRIGYRKDFNDSEYVKFDKIVDSLLKEYARS